MGSSQVEHRRYRIESLLGKGGFGRVYRAEMYGSVGFRKAVAIKLLHEEGVSEKDIQRFRDEARILGLLNDPAIIGVDPPTRLNGRWAVVMELAEGAPSNKFLRKSPMPPGVAAELIGECARALDAAYTQEVDGEPLKLLHRDLKPPNVMITKAGIVKILDFGIAKASFEAREAHTTRDLAGTVPYMAPERLEGEESPAGDVYSLGVMLRRYTMRDKSLGFGRWKEFASPPEMTPALELALSLAARMYAMEPEERPTMREVEDVCERIRRMDTSQSLRRWVESRFPAPAIDEDDDDDLLGSVLTENTEKILASAAAAADETLAGIAILSDTPAGVTRHLVDEVGAAAAATPVPETTPVPRAPVAPPPVAAPSSNAWPLIAGVAILLLVGLVGLLAVGAMFSGPSSDQTEEPVAVAQPAPEAPAPEQVVEEPVPEAAVEVQPEPSPVAVTAPAPVAQPRPVVAPSPDVAPSPVVVAPRPVVPAPEPAVVAPEPVAVAEAVEPEPVVVKKLILSSVPTGATVFVDGTWKGVTPLMGVDLAHGTHQLKMMDGDTLLFEEAIQVGARSPNRYVFKDGALGAHY